MADEDNEQQNLNLARGIVERNRRHRQGRPRGRPPGRPQADPQGRSRGRPRGSTLARSVPGRNRLARNMHLFTKDVWHLSPFELMRHAVPRHNGHEARAQGKLQTIEFQWAMTCEEVKEEIKLAFQIQGDIQCQYNESRGNGAWHAGPTPSGRELSSLRTRLYFIEAEGDEDEVEEDVVSIYSGDSVTDIPYQDDHHDQLDDLPYHHDQLNQLPDLPDHINLPDPLDQQLDEPDQLDHQLDHHDQPDQLDHQLDHHDQPDQLDHQLDHHDRPDQLDHQLDHHAQPDQLDQHDSNLPDLVESIPPEEDFATRVMKIIRELANELPESKLPLFLPLPFDEARVVCSAKALPLVTFVRHKVTGRHRELRVLAAIKEDFMVWICETTWPEFLGLPQESNNGTTVHVPVSGENMWETKVIKHMYFIMTDNIIAAVREAVAVCQNIISDRESQRQALMLTEEDRSLHNDPSSDQESIPEQRGSENLMERHDGLLEMTEQSSDQENVPEQGSENLMERHDGLSEMTSDELRRRRLMFYSNPQRTEAAANSDSCARKSYQKARKRAKKSSL